MNKKCNKKILILMLISTLILCSSCKSEPQNNYTLTLSEHAATLSITADNYPRIDGSTSTLPLVQEIHKTMFMPDINSEDMWPGLPQTASKTMASYEKLINGEVDLILVPDPSEDVLNLSEQKGVELEFIPIGAEALVFITHQDNPVTNITSAQVVDIYTDMSVANWSELGGLDGRIVPICRNADSGSQAQMENSVLNGEKINPIIEQNYMERDMNSMINMVGEYQHFSLDGEENAYTIGYTMYYYLNLYESVAGAMFVKPLAYNGVIPTPETLLSKEYPLATNYYAVLRKDSQESSPERKIANWLTGYDGQWTVARSGLGALSALSRE